MVSAAASAVAISILSAIDGCRGRKFDVRNREERTPLNVEIDRYDVVAERHAELRIANLRARRAVYIFIFQRREPVAMFVVRQRADFALVLEAHEVKQAHSSSPSMSSSATSTTTLWMSIVNHSRNDFRSRVGGHVVSSSVHAPSWNSKIQTALSSTHSWMSSSSSNSGIRKAVP